MRDVFLEQIISMDVIKREEFFLNTQLHRLELMCKENKMILPTSKEFIEAKNKFDDAIEFYLKAQTYQTLIKYWESIHRSNLKRVILIHYFDVDQYLKEYCDKKACVDVECKDYKRPYELLSFGDKLKALWNMINKFVKG